MVATRERVPDVGWQKVDDTDAKGKGGVGSRMIKPPRDGNFSCPIINYRAALGPHARYQCVASYEKNFSRYYN